MEIFISSVVKSFLIDSLFIYYIFIYVLFNISDKQGLGCEFQVS